MHSKEFLSEEVENKLAIVQSTIKQCQYEKSRLDDNMDHIKTNIDNVIAQQMETLKCRSKWLQSHAESIYELKNKALKQQLRDLQQVSGDLCECLDNNKTGDEYRMMIKNTLRLVEDTPLYLTEDGLMAFNADNAKLRDSIVNFGDISIQSNVDSLSIKDDFDTLSQDEEILVLKCSNSIEMQTKSIELMHMTSESAYGEKIGTEMETFEEKEKFDFVNPWLLKTSSDTSELIENLYTLNEVNDKWLISSNTQSRTHSPTEEKVSTWIINCIRDENTTNEHAPIEQPNRISFDQFDLPTSHFLRPNKPEHKHVTSEPPRVPFVGNPLMAVEEIISNATELSELPNTNSSDCDDRIWKINSNDQSCFKDPLDLNPFIGKGDRLTFLRSAPTTEHRFTKEKVQPNVALKHMDFILNQPNHAYLRQKIETTAADNSMCEWLVGKTSDRCIDCDESCSYIDFVEKDWLKTAIDW